MVEISNPTIEEQLKSLQKEYEAKRQVLEVQKETGEKKELPHPKETLHEVVGEKIQETAPSSAPPVTPIQPSAPPPPQISEPPSYLSPELKDKIQQLVNDVFTIGLDKTIQEIHKINNPALTDAFHEALVDKLFPELVKRGIIKEIE